MTKPSPAVHYNTMPINNNKRHWKSIFKSNGHNNYQGECTIEMEGENIAYMLYNSVLQLSQFRLQSSESSSSKFKSFFNPKVFRIFSFCFRFFRVDSRFGVLSSIPVETLSSFGVGSPETFGDTDNCDYKFYNFKNYLRPCQV